MDYRNKIKPSAGNKYAAAKVDARKVPADSVPYGSDICRVGKHVWAAYDGDRLVCVAATSAEVRLMYLEMKQEAARKEAEFRR